MKPQHRIRYKEVSYNMTGKLDPDYEREVEASTMKLEVAYEKAKRRAEAAEKRISRAAHKMEHAKVKRSRETARKEHIAALAEYEARLKELEELQALMTSTPAGSSNRGTKSYRHVPTD